MQTAGSGEKTLTAGALAALVFLPVFLLSSIIAGREISRLYALVWSLFAAGTAFGIAYTGRVSFFRRLFFSASALAFLVHFKAPLATGSAPECFKTAPFCHIAMAPYFLDYLYQQYLALMSGSWKMWGPLTLGALWLFVTLAIGRGWCSWVCFYGGIDDGLSALPRRPLFKFGKLGEKLRDLPAALLIFLMLASLAYMLPVFCLWLCPFKLTGAFLDADAGPRRAQYALMGAALAVLVLGPLLTKKRVFCSYLCPFSAWQAFWGRLNPFRVTADPGTCDGCLACAAACPMTAIKVSAGGRPEAAAYCNLCGQCLAACPRGAMNYTLLGLSLPAGGRLGRFFSARNFFIFSALTTGAVFSSLWAPAALRDLAGLLARAL